MSASDLSALTPIELLALAERAAVVCSVAGTSLKLRDAVDALQERIAERLRGSPAPVAVVTAGEDGGFVATGPHGAVSQGQTLPDALRNLAAALEISDPADAQELPRIVEWDDLRPGDLALDARAHDDGHWVDWPLVHVGKSGRRQWRYVEGTPTGSYMNPLWPPAGAQAVLIGRNVRKRADEIVRVFTAMCERALKIGEGIRAA